MKLRNKILMSAAALAACAATLTSTTFAWYVANNEANATKIQGSTAAAGSDGNILVAKTENGTAGSYAQNISFAGDTTHITLPQDGLTPVTKVVTEEGETWKAVDGSVVDEANAYMTWDVWVLSTKETNVTVSLTVVNLTAEEDITYQTCYNATGAPVAQGELFAIDAVEALRMEVFQDGTSLGVFSVKDLASGYTSPNAYTALGTADSNAYYKALMGQEPAGGMSEADPTSTTAFTALTVTANTGSKLTYKVWLEGRDKACFDSCVGQSFEFALKYTTN